jgi:hypothetical protein
MQLSRLHNLQMSMTTANVDAQDLVNTVPY